MLKQLLRHWLQSVLDLRRAVGIVALPWYIADWRRYSRLAGPRAIRWRDSYPCLTDRVLHTPFDPHYFYQAGWAARKLARAVPSCHVDVGSSALMIGMVSALVHTIFVDYRPLRARIPELDVTAGDLLALPFRTGSVHSLSCLHVIEHVGLGRYGDQLDPAGSSKAAQELMRVLASSGKLLLSIPVGRERVQFNAHRVFAPQTVLSMFSELELMDTAMVDDSGEFSEPADLARAADCNYACGMFEFARPARA